jgi:hypothetical protein
LKFVMPERSRSKNGGGAGHAVRHFGGAVKLPMSPASTS